MAPAGDHDHHRERQRGEEREAVAGQAAFARGAEHHRHADQRERHRLGGAARDRLAERHAGEQRGEHGGDGQDEQDARTLAWLSAAMKLPAAVATQSATAMPANPTDRNACATGPRSTNAT